MVSCIYRRPPSVAVCAKWSQNFQHSYLQIVKHSCNWCGVERFHVVCDSAVICERHGQVYWLRECIGLGWLCCVHWGHQSRSHWLHMSSFAHCLIRFCTAQLHSCKATSLYHAWFSFTLPHFPPLVSHANPTLPPLQADSCHQSNCVAPLLSTPGCSKMWWRHWNSSFWNASQNAHDPSRPPTEECYRHAVGVSGMSSNLNSHMWLVDEAYL